MMVKLAVILTQGFADWEYALVAGTGGPFFGFDVQFFAPHAGEVRSQGGLAAVVSNRLEDIAKFEPAVIVVVGGTIWETDAAPDIAELLKAQHANGGAVAGICGGTLALARAGLLDETTHTSNNAEFLTQNAKGYSGAEQYRDSAAAVSSERIITAPGIAPVSFAAAVFESAGLNTEALQQFKGMLAAEHA